MKIVIYKIRLVHYSYTLYLCTFDLYQVGIQLQEVSNEILIHLFLYHPVLLNNLSTYSWLIAPHALLSMKHYRTCMIKDHKETKI